MIWTPTQPRIITPVRPRFPYRRPIPQRIRPSALIAGEKILDSTGKKVLDSSGKRCFVCNCTPVWYIQARQCPTSIYAAEGPDVNLWLQLTSVTTDGTITGEVLPYYFTLTSGGTPTYYVNRTCNKTDTLPVGATVLPPGSGFAKSGCTTCTPYCTKTPNSFTVQFINVESYPASEGCPTDGTNWNGTFTVDRNTTDTYSDQLAASNINCEFSAWIVGGPGVGGLPMSGCDPTFWGQTLLIIKLWLDSGHITADFGAIRADGGPSSRYLLFSASLDYEPDCITTRAYPNAFTSFSSNLGKNGSVLITAN